MIGRLAGRLEYKADDHVLIDVHGVGYVVYVTDRTLAALPGAGEAVALYTELLVREDLLQLFGFTSLAEKEWHRLLMSVQGVGAKASLAILGALGPDGVSRAIALGDWNTVKAAKGVGPKTAQRVVNELKDKAPGVMAMSAGMSAPAPVAAPAASVASVADDLGPLVEADGAPAAARAAADPGARAPGHPAAQSEALSALTNLGYGPGEAASAVATALGEDPAVDTPTLIRAALRLLAPKG